MTENTAPAGTGTPTTSSRAIAWAQSRTSLLSHRRRTPLVLDRERDVEAARVPPATDPRNLARAATAAAKLGEIGGQLAALTGHDRAGTARGCATDRLKKLKRPGRRGPGWRRTRTTGGRSSEPPRRG